ncbi:MAG: zf-HC2 domain-containing protein [Polyangiaceae bacterium]|nr:zf-HC2 domain-containing protein [Polyangiaceae bacterium]
MECEKFEPLLLDELYDELDEVTSAAVKRHVAGCSRCASILNGMRSTRRLVDIPMVEPPPELEDRILAAARDARQTQRPHSIWREVFSRAGSWAMRPQTAMAAVFLLMIGSSAFLLRSSRDARPPEAEVSVVVRGEPAKAAADHDSLDEKAAAAAHGPTVPAGGAAPGMVPTPTAPAAAADKTASGAYDLAPKQAPSPEALATAEAPAAVANEKVMKRSAPALMPPVRAEIPVSDQGQEAFSNGMTAYRARNLGEATRQFDLAAAQNGDQNAAIWAARSTKDQNGCAAALGRYDAVAQNAAGTQSGNDALFEAANCQIALGQTDAARAKLQRLLAVPEYEARARQALENLDSPAARKSKSPAAPDRPKK